MVHQSPSVTKKLFLTFYSMTGKLPPDSYEERTCSCGYEGIFELPPESVVRNKSQFRFAFQCPHCACRLPYLLHLPLGTRIARAKTRLKKGLLQHKAGAFAGLLMIALLSVAASRNPPAKGWKILREAGPASALDWIRDPRTPHERYIEAWSHFAKGEMTRAETLNRPLLNLRIDPKTRADALYLAGLIEERKGSAMPMELYSEAIALYADLGKTPNMHQTYLSMAFYLVNQEDYGLAQHYLDMADTLPIENPDPAYFFEVESELDFGLGRFEEALEASKKSLAAYDGKDVVGTARMKSNVGFYQILTGDTETGLWTSLEAERIILDKGLNELYLYNLLNFYLHEKCVGNGGEAYAKMIDAAIAENDDQALRKYLDFARSFQCPGLSNKGDHTPPPPPD